MGDKLYLFYLVISDVICFEFRVLCNEEVSFELWVLHFGFILYFGKGYKMSFLVGFMSDKINNVVTEEKLERYFEITKEAFEIVKKSVISGKENESKEIFDMVGNYISDAEHFKERGDWVLAFAALNYAHGWIDSGVRLDVFDVGGNDRLFTIK